MKRKTRHHRRSKALGGGDDEKNISIVSERRHRAWHILFHGEKEIQEIVRELNEVWIDPDFKLIIIKKTP